jgi:hypothetical protein
VASLNIVVLVSFPCKPLGLDFLGQGGEVDLPGFVGIGWFILGPALQSVAFGLEVLGHGGGGEGLFLDVGVHQAQAVLAGELPARATAPMGRPVRAREIAGTAVGLLAAPLAFAEEDGLVIGNVQDGELVLEDKSPPMLDGVGVGRRRVNGGRIEGDHGGRSPGRAR